MIINILLVTFYIWETNIQTGNSNAGAMYDNLGIITLHRERDIDTYMQISHNCIKYPLFW